MRGRVSGLVTVALNRASRERRRYHDRRSLMFSPETSQENVRVCSPAASVLGTGNWLVARSRQVHWMTMLAKGVAPTVLRSGMRLVAGIQLLPLPLPVLEEIQANGKPVSLCIEYVPQYQGS